VLTKTDSVGLLKVTIVDDTPDGLVVSDLPDGTRIIVSGQNMVSDGQQVTAVIPLLCVEAPPEAIQVGHLIFRYS
jgi:hypothetical protein